MLRVGSIQLTADVAVSSDEQFDRYHAHLETLIKTLVTAEFHRRVVIRINSREGSFKAKTVFLWAGIMIGSTYNGIAVYPDFKEGAAALTKDIEELWKKLPEHLDKVFGNEVQVDVSFNPEDTQRLSELDALRTELIATFGEKELSGISKQRVEDLAYEKIRNIGKKQDRALLYQLWAKTVPLALPHTFDQLSHRALHRKRPLSRPYAQDYHLPDSDTKARRVKARRRRSKKSEFTVVPLKDNASRDIGEDPQ